MCTHTSTDTQNLWITEHSNPSITGLLFFTGFLMLFLKSKLSTNLEIIFSCTEWEQLYDQMVYGW